MLQLQSRMTPDLQKAQSVVVNETEIEIHLIHNQSWNSSQRVVLIMKLLLVQL